MDPDDFNQIDEDFDDEGDFEFECGRWDNGVLGRYCSKAGTEECDWDCPTNGAAERIARMKKKALAKPAPLLEIMERK